MIALPVGFDYSQLATDFFSLVVPFVGIVGLLVAFRLVRSASRSI